jgi:hypothetical protein
MVGKNKVMNIAGKIFWKEDSGCSQGTQVKRVWKV